MDLPFVRLRRLVVFACAVLLFTTATRLFADPAPFDLTGPKVEVKVTRGGQTLPVTQVPNLAAGDKLWIHPDFPPGQAAHYLLIAAFLRGSTNPPPEDWFFKAETWDKKFTGLEVTVPEGAQQVIVFLAPETGGDFKTLISAVRGRPGAFVRASQDLNQANLDRSRLDVYLAAVRRINSTDPSQLKDATPLLARSLNVELDKKCLDLDSDLQASCLTQKQDGLILNDGHSMSIVDALTSGPAGDLALQASYTPQANYGYYSPYIASVADIARILDSFHTAQYQYIPALAALEGGALELKLNTPPSFHNPKSVIVIALPAVESSQPPPLHPIDEKQVFCAEKSDLILPVDGAPLVFSTKYAHDLVLHLEAGGKTADLPLTPQAVKGGFGVDTKPLAGTVLGSDTEASVRGQWGFEPFTGPKFHLQGAREQKWQIASADQNALVVGRDDTIHLEAQDASCIDSIQYKDAQGKDQKADWKLDKPNSVEVKLPLKDAKPGDLTLVVKQAGLDKPVDIQAHTFSEAGHLESFTLHAGDTSGLLKGSRLDEVASLSVKGIKFQPGKLSSSQGSDELPMAAQDAKASQTLTSGQQLQGTATLKDGRTADLQVIVDAARPSVALIGKNIESGDSSASNIELANQDEVPQNAKLVFSIKAKSPAEFKREDKVEVATGDDSYSTVLSMGDSTLTLQDASTALATLDPAKVFGGSAFGPLRFRIIDADGTKGDWQPLATLVRLPQFQSLKCPAAADQPCKLSGANLFLVDAVSGDSQFAHPVQVPDGFPGSVLPVPHPSSGELFVKLRDDPSVVNQVKLTAENVGPPAPAPTQPDVNPIHPVQSPDGKPRPDYTRPSASSPAAPANNVPANPAPDNQPPASATPPPQAATQSPDANTSPAAAPSAQPNR
ncbi:hypothetical protein HNQ77_004276 [Silvibacterium bohemicum]|uniref:Uncharacterized protein n=1 Tax=Silvibacterium bohemicum TaxID=1577686 RepID=A0A841K7P6_9BACT|nr:hypothetical protein [Silvibacterium bohemicum]MBB6146304.1 hypothetical protein [Silvibacterium bohemicum]